MIYATKQRQNEIGDALDVVTLKLNGNLIRTYENYEVASSILTQPAQFAMRIGSVDKIAELIKSYPPGTKCELYVGDVLVQSGKTDGFEAVDDAGGTSLTMHGRDALAPLHDSYVLAGMSFKDVTYREIVERALEAVGLDKTKLRPTPDGNDANRTAITGGAAPPPRGTPPPGQALPINHEVFIRVGERWDDFLESHLGRAGLFLWSAPDGTFILTSPNRDQDPLYRIVRRREGMTRSDTNVLRATHRNDTVRRFTNCIVYSRGGGRKYGVAQANGSAIDEQMAVEYGFGAGKPLVLRDVDAKDQATADYHARRKLAEAARAGWALGYRVAGHTTPAVRGTTDLAVWAPDTMVEVDDEILGIQGIFYLESVTFRRDPSTTTELILMDPKHLLLATLEDPDGGAGGGGGGGADPPPEEETPPPWEPDALCAQLTAE